MAKGVRRLTGFLWALLIAVLSFFIIFIFFPDVSNRFFGVSVRGEDVQKVVDAANEKVTETVEKAGEALVGAVNDTVKNKVSEAADSGKRTVADTVQNSGLHSK